MYSKLKYIILTILFLGIGFGIFSFLKLYNYYGGLGYYLLHTEFLLPTILIGLIILFFFLPKSLKIKSRLLTFLALGISILCLVITLNLTLTYFSYERFSKMMNEFNELSCEQMNNRFEADIENNELKYFSFGIGDSGNLTKNLKKYNIRNYDLGCWVRFNLICYNQFVEDYLKEKNNIDINQLYE